MRHSDAFGGTTVGEILRGSLGLYKAHFVLFVSLAAVIYVPYYVALSAVRLQQTLSAMVGTVVTGIVAQALVGAMMIWVIVRISLGREVGFVSALGVLTLSLVVRIVGTALLVGVGVLAGFFLLIVPGLVLLVWFSLANQVVVVEGKAYFEALRRSMEVVRGSWWRVLYVLLVLVLINLAVLMACGVLFGEAAGAIGQIFGILFVPLWSIALTLLYFDLRAEKEGFSVASLGEFGMDA